MNMISTGAFLNEMDASNKQPTVAEKFAAVWEKKNAKAARAGGVSLMALSLAACGGSSSTTTTTTTTDTTTDTTPVTPAVDAAKTIALTTSTDTGASFTGGSGNDSFTATNLTIGAADELDGGAGTGDSLTVTATAAEAYTLANAKIDNIENINITNQSGSVSGSTETATATFQSLAAGQTVTVGGVTFTAGTSGATAAQVAAAFATPTTAATGQTNNSDNVINVAGGQLSGFTSNISAVNLAGAVTAMNTVLSTGGWSAAAGGDVNSVVFTSATATTDVTDINFTGTAVTGRTAKTTFTVAETGVGSYDSGDDLTVVVNGVTVTHPGVTATGGSDNVILADAIAAAINGHLGYTAATVATANGTTTVTVESATPVTIAGIASADAAEVTIGTITNAQSYAAAAAPTVVTTDGVSAATTGYAVTVDASKIADATTMSSMKSTGAVTFSNMAATQSGEVAGNKVLTNGNTTFGYKATVQSADVAIKDGTTAGDVTLTGAALTTVGISSSGEKNTVGTIDVAGASTITVDASTDLTATAIATTYSGTAGTLTITGAGKASIGTLDAGLNTVDASGNTGGLTALIGAETDTVLTGSSGNDKITASTSNTIANSAKLAVNAGDGEDTLVIAAANDVDTALIGARYTGFEVLSVSASQDVSLVSGITSIKVTGDTADLTKLTAAQANAITVSDADGNDVHTGLYVGLNDASGSADSTTITLADADTTQNVGITELDVRGIETVNIIATTGTNTTGESAIDFEASDSDAVKAINISGSADVKLTVDSNTLDVVAVDINASGLTGTGDFTLVASSLVNGSKVTGTANDDVMDISTTEGITYVGGGGKDTFQGLHADLMNNGTARSTFDGGAGVDKLKIEDTGAITMTDNHFLGSSNMEKLEVVATGAGDVSITTGASFNSAFSDGATVTTGDLANDDAFVLDATAATVAMDVTVTSSNLLGDNAAADDVTIRTGSADDTIDAQLTAFVSAADGGSIVISSGAGNDTINLDMGATIANNTNTQVVTINAGAGQDTVTKAAVANGTNAKAATHFIIGSGESTTTAYDTIKGFVEGGATAGDHSDLLDFAGTGAVTDFTATANSGTIMSHNLSNGYVTFDDAETFGAAIKINSSNLSDVIGYLVANTATNDVAAFAYDKDGDGTNESTMVYHNGTVDSLVLLDGNSTIDHLVSSATTTAGELYIA